MHTVLHDLRVAIRGLRRRPGLALLAVLTLALGVGANAAIFSVLYAALLRKLPFDDPERLVSLSLVTPGREGVPPRDDMVWSFPKAQTFMAAQSSFSHTALYRGSPVTLGLADGAERVQAEEATGRYLATLGVTLEEGRDFAAEEDRAPGAPRVALLSHDLWLRRFGGDQSVVGGTIQVDGVPAVVIGVLPAGFRGLTGNAEVWFNAAANDADEVSQQWSHSWDMVARLAPRATFDAALAEVRVMGQRVDAAHPEPERAGGGTWGATARPLDATRIDPVLGRTLVVLEVAVGLVLLIACANLANLFLTRAASRKREIAVRRAVGAARGHLVRHLLTESALVSVLGGVVGIGVAWLGIRAVAGSLAALSSAIGGQLGGLTVVGLSGVRLDGAVLLFCLAVTGLTALLVGLLPAVRATDPDLTEALREGGLQGGTSRRWLSVRDGLVVVELTLAVVLLAGAGLMIRSLAGLLAIDAGIQSRGVLTVRTTITAARFSVDSSVGFFMELADRAAQLPGVESAAIGNCPPLNGGCNGTVFWYRDRPNAEPGTEPLIGVHHVSPDYFRTLGVPIVRGRVFAASDVRGGPKVLVINQAAAEKFYPSEDPIGKPAAVGQGGFHDRAEIVGVVGNIRFGTVDQAPVPDAFIPYFQAPRPGAMLYLRTRMPPLSLAPAVRTLMAELHPGLPVYDIRTMDDRVGLATVRPRVTTFVLAGFAAAALLLAAIGVYGVIANDVAQRTREIGVRMALGARPAAVLGMVFRRGIVLLGLGLGGGVVVALGATRLLRALLYGVEPADPATFAAIAGVLALAGLAAIWLPARLATRVDPVEAIRAE